jgi:hypothetical protein
MDFVWIFFDFSVNVRDIFLLVKMEPTLLVSRKQWEFRNATWGSKEQRLYWIEPTEMAASLTKHIWILSQIRSWNPIS